MGKFITESDKKKTKENEKEAPQIKQTKKIWIRALYTHQKLKIDNRKILNNTYNTFSISYMINYILYKIYLEIKLLFNNNANKTKKRKFNKNIL